jgi:flavin-dependent dehydrogenase
MLVLGPTGRRVVLPARSGRSYPGHGLAITRLRFDDWLRDAALDAGAVPISARVAALVGPSSVELDDGVRIDADVLIGADGARSSVGRRAGLVDPRNVLWGFAFRGYAVQSVDRPVIALWDETPRRGFPGYGWIFPGADGVANVGLGIGMGSDVRAATRSIDRFEAFCAHLRAHGLLTAAVDGRRSGGWLKMGMVGTVAARDRVLLVGDAAGLVNPLQGEGIAPAMTSAAAAARAYLTDPGHVARRYLEHLGSGPARHAAATSAVHVAASRTPRRVALVGRALTMPLVGRLIARPWALLWNDLVDGAPPGPNRAVVRATLTLSRSATKRTAVARSIAESLAC